jgi:two-component system phosphate regulon sensor histidine kinase PhoR
MLKKISNKIVISYTTLFIILVLIISLFVNNLIRNTHLQILKREMFEKLHFINLMINQQPYLIRNTRQLAATLDSISEIINLRITIVDFEGLVLADTDVEDISTMDNHKYRIEIRTAVREGRGESIRYSNTLRSDMLYCAIKSERYVIRLSKPLLEINESLNRLRKLIFYVSGFGVLFSIFAVVLLSRRITKPINETLNFAKQFSDGNYSKRILNYSEDEIGEVQKSLNRLADALVEKINSHIFEQNKLHITLESIGDGIVVVDNNKRILIANKAFNEIFGYDRQPTGRLYFEVIRSRRLNSKIESAIKNGSEDRFEEELLNNRYFYIYINPIKEEKTLQGILIVFQDITEKKKIEQMKTDLVGNMSHELKTPITIMKGYLETIHENMNRPELCSDYIQKAIENAERQNTLINDILKLNELETSYDFVVESVNIEEIINNFIDLLKPKAVEKDIKITLDVQTDNVTVKGNKFLAEEIFFNLMDNAINYNNHSGEISVTVKRDVAQMVVTVEDTGIGIPAEQLDRIFERFYRVDKSRSRQTGGTGLGLSIVKHAAELLNWNIQVESSSAGTSFTIEI